MKQQGITPDLPDNPAPYLTKWLTELGVTEPQGMGVGPISWAAIEAWQRVVGVALSPWEARAIRGMSCAYVVEARAAEDETRPPPWAAVSASERDTESDRLRALLGS